MKPQVEAELSGLGRHMAGLTLTGVTKKSRNTRYLQQSSQTTSQNQAAAVAALHANSVQVLPSADARISLRLQAMRNLLKQFRLPGTPDQQQTIFHDTRMSLHRQRQVLLLPYLLQQSLLPEQNPQLQQILASNPALMVALTSLKQKQQQEPLQSQPVAGPPAPGKSSNTMPNYQQTHQQLIELLSQPTSPQQQDQILQFLKTNPQFIGMFIKHRQLQLQPQQSLSQMQPLQQPQPQVRQLGIVTSVPDNSSNTVSKRRQAVQQLMDVLRSPSSPQQNERVTQLINTYPFLMAPLIKYRQQQQQLQERSPRQRPIQQPGIVQPTPGSSSSSNGVPRYYSPLQQLFALLREPNSPQQQDQILQILKTSPPLMGALLKRKMQLQQLSQRQSPQLPQFQVSVFGDASDKQQDQPQMPDNIDNELIGLESLIDSFHHFNV